MLKPGRRYRVGKRIIEALGRDAFSGQKKAMECRVISGGDYIGQTVWLDESQCQRAIEIDEKMEE